MYYAIKMKTISSKVSPIYIYIIIVQNLETKIYTYSLISDETYKHIYSYSFSLDDDDDDVGCSLQAMRIV
jgi:hypothetical protein